MAFAISPREARNAAPTHRNVSLSLEQTNNKQPITNQLPFGGFAALKRTMVLIIAILVSIPLAIGVMAGLAYYTTGEGAVPRRQAEAVSAD